MNSLLNVIAEQVNTYVASLHEFRNSVGIAFKWVLEFITTHEHLLHLLINVASATPHILLHVRQIWCHYLHFGITAWPLNLFTLATVYWYAAFINNRNIKIQNLKSKHNASHVYLPKRSIVGNINIQYQVSGIHNIVFTGRYGLDFQMQFVLTCLKWTCMAQYNSAASDPSGSGLVALWHLW